MSLTLSRRAVRILRSPLVIHDVVWSASPSPPPIATLRHMPKYSVERV